MQKMRMVSVVIPVWGEYKKYLSECLERVKQQTFVDYEVIVVENKTDLPSARNEGIRKSKGKYILTLDVDDYIDNEYLNKTVGIGDIVTTGTQEFGASNNYHKPQDDFSKEAFLNGNRLVCCSLFKKEIWEKIGGYDETMKIGYEDWEFWTRAIFAGYEVKTIDEPLFFYRMHNDSMINQTIKKHNELKEYICKKHTL